MKKQVIDSINQCYSVNAVTIEGEICLIYAGEGNGSVALYKGEDFSEKIPIWTEADKRGGTMSICIPEDKEGYFFLSTGFFSMVDSHKSAINLVKYKDGQAVITNVCDVPYLHRFDVLTVGKRRYLIACTLHSGKKDLLDWSSPGKIFTAELPYDLDSDMQVELDVLKDGITQNHGFCKTLVDGIEVVLTAGRDGVHQITPPQEDGDMWKVQQIFDFPASDICAYDLDQDGELEYGVITPFHGDKFEVYKKHGAHYERIYTHPKKLDFYHAIYADSFQGVPSFIIGARKEDMDLYQVIYHPERKRIETVMIETGAGSSNVKIVHNKTRDLILSANRQKNEAAIYWQD